MLKNSPYLLLLLAACFWGGNFVVGKALVAHMPPITLAAIRWSVAFLCLLPLFGREAWRHRSTFMTHYKSIIFLALTGVAGFNTLTYIAVQYTGSINASLMNSATPIFVLLLSRFLLSERIVVSAIPGIVVSMLGVAWIIGRGSMDAILGLRFNQGDLWMVAAIACWALYSVGMKKSAGRFPATPLLLVQTAIALVVLIPLAAAETAVTNAPIEWSASLVFGLLYVGIFASIAAFLAWNRAIALIGPQRCAGFLNFIPLFSAIFAAAFTGEQPHGYHLLGAVLIISGVYAANRMLRRQAAGGTNAG
ncbi:DMT family transporter [Paenibacillus chartarius]|uniref:DMT family transporter n=1 Tax=Paenibacillus chartarius TaxID=747481 RepID=A0ABV6DHP3_9BACL